MPRGTKITNDAVSLEAGRGKGSIKRSRVAFADLIRDIDEAAAAQAAPAKEQKRKLDAEKEETKSLQKKLDAALGRERALVKELYETKEELSLLTGAKVVPSRRARKSKEKKRVPCLATGCQSLHLQHQGRRFRTQCASKRKHRV